MEANKILQSDVLDILFENRNKNYGAYELRTTYNKRIAWALTGMTALCLMFIGASIFAGSHNGPKSTQMLVKDFELIDVKNEPPKEEIKLPEPPKPQQIAQIRDVVPRIVPDDQVKPEDVVPDVADVEDTHIGSITTPGDKGDVIAPPVEKGTGKVETIGNKEEDFEKEFVTVQVQAKFPGGFAEWEKFLKRNLRAEIPTENGAAPNIYAVMVSFLVNKDGSISEVRAENDPGYGTADEAVRVIKKSGQWIPAVQNGRNVIYRQRQKISFVVEEGN